MKKKNLQRSVKEALRQVSTTLPVDITVGEAVALVKRRKIEDNVIYFYVVDERQKLIGIVKAKDLLLKESKTPISHIIETKVKSLRVHHTLQDALAFMQKYRLLALPVIENGKFLGVLDIQNYFDESLKIKTTKKRDEIFKMLGFFLGSEEKQSLWKKYKKRVPWVFCNMAGGIACAIISDIYEVLLEQVIVLAMFIPLVLALSESISMQTMTQILYQMSKRAKKWFPSWAYILSELVLLSLISLTCGIFVGALSILWGDGWGPAVIIGVTIAISVVISAFIAGTIPILLHRWKLDPKIASGPIVLAFADVITTIIYLSLGFSWLIAN